MISKSRKLTKEQKEKWMTVMRNDMSSEESDENDDTIVVHPLPWRSPHVNKMFERIDKHQVQSCLSILKAVSAVTTADGRSETWTPFCSSTASINRHTYTEMGSEGSTEPLKLLP